VSGLFTSGAFGDDGPLYLQLTRRIAAAIDAGDLEPGQGLPPEREMAAMTGLSRVTVRKAVQALVQAGRLVQRRGSGTFVAPGAERGVERVEQALSLLTSFSEDMARRGRTGRSVWLSRAVQRISAANLGPRDAGLLEVPVGAAGLKIERVSYLASGRVVEFTRSLYRGDAYDFAAELRLPAEQEGRE
jgi:GntR family transcriptional regulator